MTMLEDIVARKQQLENDLRRLEQQELSNKVSSLRTLESFTDAEKVAAFDRLHTQISLYLAQMLEKRCQPKDGDHYIYEEAMELTLGSGVWEVVSMALK
jgi:hypothetical protein